MTDLGFRGLQLTLMAQTCCGRQAGWGAPVFLFSDKVGKACVAALLPGCWALGGRVPLRLAQQPNSREAPLKKTSALEGSSREEPGAPAQGPFSPAEALPGLSAQGSVGSSVLGWWGLVDDDLDDKIFLDLGFLEPRAVCEQLPREEPSLPGRLDALLGVQLPLELPHCVGQAGAEPHVLARGEAHLQRELTTDAGCGLWGLHTLLLSVFQQQVHRWRQAVDGQLVAIAQLIVAFTESACGKDRAIRVSLGAELYPHKKPLC